MLRTRTTFRLLAAALGLALFAALIGWGEYANWNGIVGSNKRRLIETARTVAQHSDDVFALADQTVDSLAMTIAEGGERDRAQLQGKLARMIGKSGYIRALAFIDRRAKVVEAAREPDAEGLANDEPDYFAEHRDTTGLNPKIGLAVRAATGGDWYIPISRRVVDRDGAFAGVAVAFIGIPELSRFAGSFNRGLDGSHMLLRQDGMILSRMPRYDQILGESLAETELFRNVREKRRGSLNYVARIDGTNRFAGFYRSERTGVTAIVAVSVDAIRANWIERSQTRWAAIGLILAGVVVALRYWIHQARQSDLAARRIAAQEADFRLIAAASQDLIERLSPDGKRLYVSPAASDILGQAPETLVGGQILDGLDEEAAQDWRLAVERLRAGAESQRILLRRANHAGEIRWLESVITRTPTDRADRAGKPQKQGVPFDGMVVISRDVTNQQLLHQALDKLALTDETTGLYNRRHLNKEQARLRDEAAAKGQPLSMMLIDLDRFKLFNDTYGHVAGDACLKDVAGAIREVASSAKGIAARYGGEEMAMLLPGLGPHEALAIAEAVRARVCALAIQHRPNLPWGHVTVSIGVAALGPDENRTAEDLTTAADAALYRAKNEGRNRVSIHNDVKPRLYATA